MAAPSLVIFGVTGRMGQSLVRALRETPQITLGAALASPSSARIGKDAAAEGESTGIVVTADARAALSHASVAVDFSHASCVAANAQACSEAGVPLLVGTTGYDSAAHQALDAAAKRCAVLVSPNTSVGIAVMSKLAALATAGLGTGFDVAISDAHHRMKRDSPSGTALALGEAVAGARGRPLAELARFGRGGDDAPAAGTIGFSATRAGDLVGDHTVLFAGEGERLEITHTVTDRMIFARGALRGALWLIGRPPGLYSMHHVLGL
jgi:4-hydroxy-tetrahydrodipicolinate reductase